MPVLCNVMLCIMYIWLADHEAVIIISTRAPFFPRWSGCVITAGSSRRSWPSQASGSLGRLGNSLASVQPSASHLCAKLQVTRISGLAPKHPRAPSPQTKTPPDPAHLGQHLASTLGHVVSHHETRKLKQCGRTCAIRQSIQHIWQMWIN